MSSNATFAYAIASVLADQIVKHPIKTFIWLCFTIYILFYIGGFIEKEAQEKSKSRLSINTTYTEQIKTLNATSKNLSALVAFVESQKKQLESSEVALSLLRSEHEKMKPLLEIDRKTIDALFAAQEARAKSEQLSERWFGFILGIVASVIASILVSTTAILWRKRKASMVI